MDTNKLRPPIVAVLGHVDHGKTTLLDALRQTNIQGKEAGGITQSIGASVVKTKEGKEITFIDTPGHAAFEKMRSRGANACDMALLVVSAADSVEPQTVEAINHIKKADIPYIVVITKTDLPSANVNKTREDLNKNGVAVEGKGGSVPVVEVSAKDKSNIEALIELISLVAEVGGVGREKDDFFEAVVIETSKQKAGPSVSVVIKKGILKVGDELTSDGVKSNIRGLFDYRGERINSIGAGYPAMILGFSFLPKVGSVLIKSGEKQSGADKAQDLLKVRKIITSDQKPIILKAATSGALEAITSGLNSKIFLLDYSLGDIVENDVLTAKSTGSLIIAFETKISSRIRNLAKNEGVEIREYSIIYKLFEDLDEFAAGDTIKTLGKLEIIAIFPFDGKKVAGCRIIEGIISKNDTLINEGDLKKTELRIVSIKKQKQQVENVKRGEECGIFLEPQVDFKVGDVLLSVQN